PCLRRTLTDSRCPSDTAKCRGVRPLGSTASIWIIEITTMTSINCYPVIILPHGGVQGKLHSDVIANVSRGHLPLYGASQCSVRRLLTITAMGSRRQLQATHAKIHSSPERPNCGLKEHFQ
ncbi:hypothetical protein INR49_006212, partial [Caranx melampygus]